LFEVDKQEDGVDAHKRGSHRGTSFLYPTGVTDFEYSVTHDE